MRILLVRLSSFGDVLLTLPAAKALKSLPGVDFVELAWAVEEPFADLLVGAPYVDRVIATSTRAWRKRPLWIGTRRAIAASLASARAFRPDCVVDAQGLFKSAWMTLLVPAARKIGFGPGTATESINCLTTREWVDARARPHVVDRGLALAEYLGAPPGAAGRVPDVEHLVARPDREVDDWLGERAGRPFVLIQPFASRRSKEWSARAVGAFCMRMRQDGLDCVIRWGPGERERAEVIVLLTKGGALLAPRTGPASTARLASAARLFVGADTGPTHLAAAAGVPTVALFGPTDPARFAPIGPNTRLVLAGTGGLHAGREQDRRPYNRERSESPEFAHDDVVSAALSLLKAPS